MVTSVSQLNLVLVEDHDILRRMLTQVLEEAGHQVTALTCAEELEDEAGGRPVDIFIFDLNLPGEDGLSLTERVRTAYPLTGIIIVTARIGLNDKLQGYARGADLYLTKPLEVAELCAAVSSLARRRQRFDGLLQPQTFTLSQQQMTLTLAGRPHAQLSAAETAMLVAFSRAPGQRLAYWQIAENLGLDLNSYPKSSLEVRIVRLRKKLVKAGADASSIEAVRKLGYQLCIPIQIV